MIVLAGALINRVVVIARVAPCGCSDLGTPARLQPFLVSDHPAA